MKYYPISLDISNRRCVIVGGGEVAERKAGRLIESGAEVVVVSRRLTPVLERFRDGGRIRHVPAEYDKSLLEGAFLVFGTTDDPAVNEQVFRDARELGILVNVADDPKRCDFILPSLFERGDLQIAVSTGGKSPALARRLREEIEGLYGPEYAVYLSLLGDLRKKLMARGFPQHENKRLFEAVIASDLLNCIRSGERERAAGIIRGLTGVDLDLKEHL